MEKLNFFLVVVSLYLKVELFIVNWRCKPVNHVQFVFCDTKYIDLPVSNKIHIRTENPLAWTTR